MNIKLTLTLDDQVYAVASGVFPDGAVWLKVTDALPTFARLMRIRATAMRDMNDFMLLAQLVEAVRHQTDVLVSHLDLPGCRGRVRDRHMVSGDSFALKVFASQLNTLKFDKVNVLDPHSDAAAAQSTTLWRSPGGLPDAKRVIIAAVSAKRADVGCSRCRIAEED